MFSIPHMYMPHMGWRVTEIGRKLDQLCVKWCYTHNISSLFQIPATCMTKQIYEVFGHEDTTISS